MSRELPHVMRIPLFNQLRWNQSWINVPSFSMIHRKKAMFMKSEKPSLFLALPRSEDVAVVSPFEGISCSA